MINNVICYNINSNKSHSEITNIYNKKIITDNSYNDIQNMYIKIHNNDYDIKYCLYYDDYNYSNSIHSTDIYNHNYKYKEYNKKINFDILYKKY